MKSEHRHELAENDLNKLIGRARDKIEPHANKIVIGMLVATVAAVGAIMFVKAAGASRQAGFTQLAACTTAEEFEAVADDYADTPAGIWARMRAAQEHLQEGIELSLTDRAGSNERLGASRASYEQVLDKKDAPPEVREKALYGIAMCLESLAGDDEGIDRAISAYEQLTVEFPDTRYKKWAEERIEVLGTDDARDFYKWFQTQNPKPVDRPSPFDTPNPFAGMDNPFTTDPMFDDDLSDIPPPPPSAERFAPAPTPPGESDDTDDPTLPDPASDESETSSDAESSDTESPDTESSDPESPAADAPDSQPGEAETEGDDAPAGDLEETGSPSL